MRNEYKIIFNLYSFNEMFNNLLRYYIILIGYIKCNKFVTIIMHMLQYI